MNILKKIGGVFAALIAALALALGVAAPASANVAGTANGTGSDTTQDVMNGYANVSGGTVGSWDALGGRLAINGVTFDRPNGSGNGVRALSAAVNGVAWGNSVEEGTTTSTPLTKDQVAFARSSSGPAAGTGLTYIPFGIDAVTYATSATFPASGIPLTAPDGELSLQAIYSADAFTSLEHNGTVYTVGEQGSGADIVPFMPQEGSGTRSFWEGQIGGEYGDIVSDTYTVGSQTFSVQEHNGRVTAFVPGAIVPFSIAQWVAQNNAGAAGQNEQPGSIAGVDVTDRRWNAQLGAIGGQPATVGAGSSLRLNPVFPVQRSVYNVVDTNDIGQSAEAYQVAINEAFVGSNADLYTAVVPGTSQNLINAFGFGTHPNAGSTSLQGGLTFP